MAFFDFNALPGLGTARETIEKMFLWGRHEQAYFRSAIVLNTSTDLGNANGSAELRPGLAMSQLSTSKWAPYKSTAIDGSEVCQGFLAISVKMTDLSGTTSDRLAVMIVAGPIKGSQLLYNAPVQAATTLTGLDQQARAQMHASCVFDDDLTGNLYSWKHWITKGANYTVLPTDNGTVFEATTGAVTFTLPALLDAGSNPICKGMRFKFVNTVAATMIVQRAGTDNLIAFNNASAVSVTYSTGGAQIGATVEIEVNTAGTKWVATSYQGTATIA